MGVSSSARGHIAQGQNCKTGVPEGSWAVSRGSSPHQGRTKSLRPPGPILSAKVSSRSGAGSAILSVPLRFCSDALAGSLAQRASAAAYGAGDTQRSPQPVLLRRAGRREGAGKVTGECLPADTTHITPSSWMRKAVFRSRRRGAQEGSPSPSQRNQLNSGAAGSEASSNELNPGPLRKAVRERGHPHTGT